MATSRYRTSIPVATIICCCIMCGFVRSSVSDDAPKSRDAVLQHAPKWLGSQTQPKSVREGFTDFDELYSVSLIVIPGDKLKAMKDLRNVVHFDETVRRAPEDWREHVENDAKYVLGRINKKERWHLAVYTVDCRIEDGPLKGAIVHLRDNRFPEDKTTDMAAYYRIPDDIEIEGGTLKFQIIRTVDK